AGCSPLVQPSPLLTGCSPCRGPAVDSLRGLPVESLYYYRRSSGGVQPLLAGDREYYVNILMSGMRAGCSRSASGPVRTARQAPRARHEGEGTGWMRRKKSRGKCRNGALSRACPAGMCKDAGVLRICCTRCDNIFVTCESRRPCESGFVEFTKAIVG